MRKRKGERKGIFNTLRDSKSAQSSAGCAHSWVYEHNGFVWTNLADCGRGTLCIQKDKKVRHYDSDFLRAGFSGWTIWIERFDRPGETMPSG